MDRKGKLDISMAQCDQIGRFLLLGWLYSPLQLFLEKSRPWAIFWNSTTFCHYDLNMGDFLAKPLGHTDRYRFCRFSICCQILFSYVTKEHFVEILLSSLGPCLVNLLHCSIPLSVFVESQKNVVGDQTRVQIIRNFHLKRGFDHSTNHPTHWWKTL